MMRDKSSWLLVVSLCLGFLAAACSSGSETVLPAPPPASADGEYRLGTGDQLRVTVFGHEDLSVQTIVVDPGDPRSRA